MWHWRTRNASAEDIQELLEQLQDADAALAGRAEPVSAEPARQVRGLAPRHIRPPSWWKGDRAAFRSTVKAGAQLGEPAAKAAAAGAQPPRPGRR